MSRRVLFVITVVALAYTARTWIDWRSEAARAAMPSAAAQSPMNDQAAGAVETARDPVCGTAVNQIVAKAEGRVATYQGRTLFFCSHLCRRDFEADPARFAPSGSSVFRVLARGPQDRARQGTGETGAK